MDSYVCRIERLNNGYEVELTDPAIVAANKKRDNSKGPYTPWRDPKVGYVFKTVKEVTDFLSKNLDKALPLDEYGSSFDDAVAEASEDE